MNSMTENVEIVRLNIADGQATETDEIVAKEVPLHIFLGGIHFVSVLCSPAMLKSMVVGHLLSEGVVNSVDEIVNVEFKENRGEVTLQKIDAEEAVVVSKSFARLIVSACGGGGYRSLHELLETVKMKPLPSWQIEAKTLLKCVRQLNVLGETYRKTGGVHVAALFERGGSLVVLAEDVGRHNAVDKVIGAASLIRRDFGQCFIALSGRMTADIVLKAARVGVPLIASMAATIDSGVEVAKKAGVTMVGFVRGSKMNAYTSAERVTL